MRKLLSKPRSSKSRDAAAGHPPPHIPQMRPLFALLFATAPFAALADCPTKADLAGGVTLYNTRVGGSITYAEINGTLTAASRTSEGQDLKITYAHPLALSVTESHRTRLTYRYDTDLAPLDHPETLPNEGYFTVTGSVTNQDGVAFPLAIDWQLIGPGSVTIGDCRYDTIRLSYEEYVDDAFLRVYTRSFAPTLGLVVEDIAFDPDTETSYTFGYDRISIGAP